MKILALAVLLVLPSMAMAQGMIMQDGSTLVILRDEPQTLNEQLSALWDGISASKNFHLLDNGSVLTFKDTNHGDWYGGVSTTLYNYKYLNIDMLGVKSLASGGKTYPGAGASLLMGKFLYDDIPFVKKAADYVGKSAPLISSGNIGLGAFRRFDESRWVVGVYGQLVAKFGGE